MSAAGWRRCPKALPVSLVLDDQDALRQLLRGALGGAPTLKRRAAKRFAASPPAATHKLPAGQRSSISVLPSGIGTFVTAQRSKAPGLNNPEIAVQKLDLGLTGHGWGAIEAIEQGTSSWQGYARIFIGPKIIIRERRSKGQAAAFRHHAAISDASAMQASHAIHFVFFDFPMPLWRCPGRRRISSSSKADDKPLQAALYRKPAGSGPFPVAVAMAMAAMA